MEEAAKTFEHFAGLPPVLQWLIGLPAAAIAIAWYIATLRRVARGDDERRDKHEGDAPATVPRAGGDPGFAAFTLIAHTMPELLSRLTVIQEGVGRIERQQAKRDEDFEREQAERDKSFAKLVDLVDKIKRRFSRLLEKLGEPRDEEGD